MPAPVSRPPRRTCVSCRETGDKRELVRIVRNPDGTVALDLTGKKPGRGAYLCLRRECWLESEKKGRLAAALRTSLDAATRRQVLDFAAGLEGAVVV